MKLSKVSTKKHLEAVGMVKSSKKLNLEERFFVVENWNPLAEHNIGVTGTYFTPMGLAKEIQIEVSNNENMRLLDLCAGTGRLALHFWAANTDSFCNIDIVCIERNPAFIEVGKRVLPEATWICADAFDSNTYTELGRFDEVISNPPFGLNIKSSWLSTSLSQYAAAEIAMKVSDRGVFILPQADCPFEYSGCQSFKRISNAKYEKFEEKSGVVFEMNSGLDTTLCEDKWVGTNIKTELVLVSKIMPEEDCIDNSSDLPIFTQDLQKPQIQIGLF